MFGRLEDFSGTRVLAGTTSLFGLALMGIAWGISQNHSPLIPLLALPFLVVLIASIAPISPSTRALFLWLASAAAVFPAALTIFSGLGFFLGAIILAWLIAAWFENKSGSPSPRRLNR